MELEKARTANDAAPFETLSLPKEAAIDEAVALLTKEASSRKHLWSRPTTTEIADTRRAALELLSSTKGQTALLHLLVSSHGIAALSPKSISRTGMRSLLEMLRARGEEPNHLLLKELRGQSKNLAYLNLQAELRYTLNTITSAETELHLLLDKPEPGVRVRQRINSLLSLPANLTFDRTSNALNYYSEKTAQYAPAKALQEMIDALSRTIDRSPNEESKVVAYEGAAVAMRNPKAFHRATESFLQVLGSALSSSLLRERACKDIGWILKHGSCFQRSVLLDLIQEDCVPATPWIAAALLERSSSPLVSPAERKRCARLLTEMLEAPLDLRAPSLSHYLRGMEFSPALSSQQELEETLADSIFTLHQISELKTRCSAALLDGVQSEDDIKEFITYLKQELDSLLPFRLERRVSAVQLLTGLDDLLRNGPSIEKVDKENETFRPITSRERSALRVEILGALRGHRSGIFEQSKVNLEVWNTLSTR